MTKSTGVGRGKGSGGVRPGSGRKKKSRALMVIPQETIAAADETIRKMRESDAPASGMVALAYTTLKLVMENGLLDGPRVSAAKAIIELAKQEKTEAASGPTGKKAEQAAAAHKVASEPVEGWGEDLMAVPVDR